MGMVEFDTHRGDCIFTIFKPVGVPFFYRQKKCISENRKEIIELYSEV